MEDKLSIRVNVADRYYPLKIDRKDEEKIRKAAKILIKIHKISWLWQLCNM